MAQKEARRINVIIREMIADMRNICNNQKTPTTWREKYWAAAPYINALLDCETVNDQYGADSAKILIAYLLGNLSGYKGDKAKALKKELKDLIK